MSKIAFFELEGWENETIKKSFPSDELFLSASKLDKEYSGDGGYDFDIVSVFVNSVVSADIINRFPNLKFITTRSTGFDHIDLKEAEKSKISVSYVPGYGDNTVAEFAFGLLLNLTRKIYKAIDQIKETGSFSFKGLRGVDLKGKTIGVIGTGRIGKEMINISKGFGMNVVAFDPYPNLEYAKQAGYEYKKLDDLLAISDFISIHTPYNNTTHHLININNVKLIKKGAYLINTARGGIVETEAIFYGVNNGILAGVGLDVLEEEGDVKDEMRFFKDDNLTGEKMKTMIENHMLMKMENVLITPHNAFNSQEALQRILNTTIQNINGFKGGNINPKNIAK